MDPPKKTRQGQGQRQNKTRHIHKCNKNDENYKATHAQRGLPHTSIHSHSNTDPVHPRTTLTHLQALKIVIMYLCHGLL